MPPFAWLFDVVDQAPPGVTPVPLPKAYASAHGVVVPGHQAEALVAYLLSLKQPALPDSSSSGGVASAPSPGPAASVAAAGSAPGAGGYDAAKGKALFTANCAACHQATGEGIPGAFPPLKGNAAVDDPDPTTHLHVVLHGLQGKNVGGVVYSGAMPAFAATLDDAEIANIMNYERGSWGNHGKPVSAAQVAAERANVK